MIKDYPVLGVGLNAYSIAGKEYKKEYQIDWGGYPHNCYLQMAAEIGIMGVMIFIFLIYKVFREAECFYRQSQDPFVKAVLWGGLAGMTAYLVHSIFDTTMYSAALGILLWLLIGIIMVPTLIKEGA